MPKFRSRPTCRADGKRARVWNWQAALIFVPLLLLAGFGVRGLQVNRRAVFEEARTLAARDLARALAAWPDPFQSSDVRAEWVRLYPVPPRPVPPNGAQELLREALAAPENERVAALGEFIARHSDELAESGLPLAALAAWARWEIDRQPEPLLDAAVVRHPSILTAEFLRRASMDATSDPARQRWEYDEALRAIARGHGGGSGWAPADEPTVWIENDRVISRKALRGVAEELAQTLNSEWAGEYAGATIAIHGVPLVTAPFRDVHAFGFTPPGTDGPSTPALLARSERFGFQVDAVLADPARLYAPIERQTRWLGGLLVCALGAAAAGYWTLRRALTRERELGEAKSNFVSAVSHELRAPIASMRLMAENLESEGVVEPARRGEYHRLIAEECRRLSVLIENVLDFARIEQDRKTYRFAETDVVALTRDAIALFQPRAAQRGQKIDAEFGMRNTELANAERGMRNAETENGAPARDASIPQSPVCDALAIQQALINLLDNALKFSPAESAITVRVARPDAEHWSLAVIDQGPGVPAAEQERIFERFYRIGSELCRETQGAGIGLSLVRHIAESHGGRVMVESEPGKGSTFTMVLPYQPPRAGEEKSL
ncbi:MAG: HAMP domain-containing sensor histidine kinase [Chthoniobacteraceae bacterium]